MTPSDNKAILQQIVGDSWFRQRWGHTHMLIEVRNWALADKDVKNEGRPDYVYENKSEDDKMYVSCGRFLSKLVRFAR